MINTHVGFIPSSPHSPLLKRPTLSASDGLRINDFTQQSEDFRNITTLFEPLLAQRTLHSLFLPENNNNYNNGNNYNHLLSSSSRHSLATTPREERDKRKGNEQKSNENRAKAVDIYLELKDAYFDHNSLVLQQEALKCVIFVKRKKQKLRDMKDFPIDDLMDILRNCHTNVAQWKITQDKIHYALKQHRDLCEREHMSQLSHSVPLDEILSVLATDWHSVLVTLSGILTKITKRIGRTYSIDGGGFPRLFEVLERYFSIVNEVFAIFPRAYLRKTTKNYKSATTTTAQHANTARTPRTPRASHAGDTHAHAQQAHTFTHAHRSGVSSTFSFLASPTNSKSPLVPKLALGSVNNINPSPTIKPLASIAQAFEGSKNSARASKEKHILSKMGCCKVLAAARAHFVFSNNLSSTPPSISTLEDIFHQESRFISSSPLHTPHPFDSTNSKKIENLDIDIHFRHRNSLDEIPIPNSNNLNNLNSNQIRFSGTLVDNAGYLEIFSNELCRLFRSYFSCCADLQMSTTLESHYQPPKAEPSILSHQVALECYRVITAIFFSRQFGTFQGNYFRMLPKEKFRLPTSSLSPLGTVHVSDPFKALGQALDHAIRLTTRVQDLPSISHTISQIFSLFLAIVHWANTPKTLALPLPSLCVLLSNIRHVAQKMKLFCDMLTRQETAQSKLQHSRPRYQPTLQPLPPPSVSISSHQTSLSVPSTPLNSSSSSTLNSSSSSTLASPYPPQQFRQHKHYIQQLLSLHFHLLILSGRISDRIETECRSLVSKFTTAAPADIFAVPKKSTQVSANSEKSSGAIFVASSRSKSNLASSLTSLSLPSVPPNEFIAPTSVTQKMVDKILDPALATLLQCEQGTRYGVVSSFLRIVLIGLESVAKKVPPRSLTFPNAVQIAADVDYIRNWAIQAEETFQSIKEKNREQEKREHSSLKEFEEDEEDEEDGKYGSFNSGNSSARKGSFSGYRISNMQSINESFSANNKTGTKNTNTNNANITLSQVTEIQPTPFSNSKDFERWEKIIEILTSCTNSERVVTREDIENSIILDASQWAALCKK